MKLLMVLALTLLGSFSFAEGLFSCLGDAGALKVSGTFIRKTGAMKSNSVRVESIVWKSDVGSLLLEENRSTLLKHTTTAELVLTKPASLNISFKDGPDESGDFLFTLVAKGNKRLSLNKFSGLARFVSDSKVQAEANVICTLNERKDTK